MDWEKKACKLEMKPFGGNHAFISKKTEVGTWQMYLTLEKKKKRRRRRLANILNGNDEL